MMKPLDLTGIVMLLGSIHGFLLSAALLAIRRGNRVGNRILAVLLLFFSTSILGHTFAHTKYTFKSQFFEFLQPFFLHLFEPLAFFYIIAFTFGPLIYLYIGALTVEQFRFRRKALLHFLPSIICFFTYALFFFPGSTVPDHLATKPEGLSAIVPWLISIQMALYIFSAINLVQNYQGNRKNAQPSITRKQLNWLRLLIIAFLMTWIVALLTEVYSSQTESWNYLWILVSILIYTIGYMGLRQPEIFRAATEQNLVYSRKRDIKKYEKSTLTDARADEYLKKLQNAMSERKLYLRNDLSLKAVAKELSISHHHLSQVINQRLNMNFYELVNSLRIEEAKHRLTDSNYAHLSIAEIAYEVGFNSLASFNSAFKKFSQMTPSQFRAR